MRFAPLALVAICSCAPVTMSPMAIRMSPGDLSDSAGVNGAFGFRSGPRMSSSIASTNSRTTAGLGTFSGDRATFNLEQWSVAYDLVLSKSLNERTAIFIGGQGELYYPLPLPAYGLYGGLSQYYRVGGLGIGPVLAVRGATDFGLGVVGGPGSIAGTEVSCSFGKADPKLPFAIVPFYGAHAVVAGGKTTLSQYVGGAVAMQIHFKNAYLELTGGFGRVFQDGIQSWNSPIIGVRVGH